MSEKCYVTIHVVEADGYECMVREVKETESLDIYEMMDCFVNYLRSATYSEETILEGLDNAIKELL